MREAMNYNTSTQEQPSLGELFSNLSNQVSQLIRQEIQLAQAEISRKAMRAGRNAALIALGGVVGLGAFLALVAALILLLAQVMEAWVAALIVGVVLAIAAAVLARYGLNKLKEIDPAPRRTIETMRENKEWLTQQI
jgi:MFS family permease